MVVVRKDNLQPIVRVLYRAHIDLGKWKHRRPDNSRRDYNHVTALEGTQAGKDDEIPSAAPLHANN